MSVDGFLGHPSGTPRAFHFAAAIGEVMRSDRSLEPLRRADDMPVRGSA